MALESVRLSDLRRGVRLELVTVSWMVVEAGVALAAGIVARSFLLVAFGLDSLIELVSGAMLLWRLSLETREGHVEGGSDGARQAEQRASWVVAVSLALLCCYVLGTSLYGLLAQAKPESSPVGILLCLAAAIVMPYLGVSKRRVAARIGSDALRGDAAESFTCGYMAATVLLGLALDALFHWWWAEDVAALGFLVWLIGETREAFEEAREDGDPADDAVS